MEHEAAGGLLTSVVIYLAAAVISVPLFRLLGLGTVLGYLVAGAVIGPFGLGLIGQVESILHFSEFGVVMLMFLIGLELEPRKLWSMRVSILGSGGMQVALSALIIAGAALALGVTWRESVVVGMGLALSSTAIALSIITERNLTTTPAGRTGFSVLLFQDIAVIPMIALIPLLATAGATHSTSGWGGALKGVAVIVVIVLFGRYLLRHVFRYIASTGVREVFTAFSLLLVCGIAWAVDLVGLSMALGTFLAGVLLAESEYRHALETDIEPFKGLLLGLFFISVGMSINFDLLVQSPWLILALVAALVAAKMLVLALLGLLSGVPKSELTLLAVLLSQGGEFAFVLFGIATGVGALGGDLAQTLTLVVALSMVTTPLLLLIEDRLIAPRFADVEQPEIEETFPEDAAPVIVAGFGRFGQIVARTLNANQFATVVIDHNPNHLERIRRFGYKAFYGDVTRADLLHSAGAGRARLLVVATDRAQTTTDVVKMAKSEFPSLKIVARAFDRPHSFELRKLGVDHVVRETFVSALYAGSRSLESLGMPAHEAYQATLELRDYDRKLVQEQYAVHGDDDAMIAVTQRVRESLEETLESDRQRKVEADKDGGWDR